MAPMDEPLIPSAFYARRANVDDLPALHALWQRAGLPWDQLERFLTEFLVVADEHGSLVAAIGLNAEGDHGLVHSEAVLPHDDAPAIRAALWQRIQIVARNHGVARVWTLEDDDFWKSLFQPASAAEVANLKATFADPSASWRTFLLSDPARAQWLLDERLALWDAHRQADAEHFSNTIARVRQVAFIVAGAVILMMVLMVAYVVIRRPDAFQSILGRFGGR